MARHYQQQQDLQHYRLRSPRAKRRAVIEDRDKHLIHLYHRQRELWAARRILPLIELQPPVVRGWKRTFVLRDDVAGGKDAEFYEGILARINTVQYSHRKDFKKKRRRHGKKIHVPTEQHLQKPDAWHWAKCKFTDREAARFEPVAEFHKDGIRWRWTVREPWRFALRVLPNVITHVKPRDSTIEAELAAIDDYLKGRGLTGRLDKIVHGSTYRWWKYEPLEDPWYILRRPFRNKPLHTLINKEVSF